MSVRKLYDEVRGYLVQAHGVAARELTKLQEEAVQAVDLREAEQLATRIQIIRGIQEDIEVAMKAVPLFPPSNEKDEK